MYVIYFKIIFLFIIIVDYFFFFCRLMIDFFKMEGIVECGFFRKEIMLNKIVLLDLEEGIKEMLKESG